MGSTVTTGRKAAAFRAPSGAVIYCLYERTYEKNCYPHTPRWGAIYIGPATGALQKVFNYASACEGGMLQNRSGWMTPEGYLGSWMSELRSPVRMTRDHGVGLHVKDDSIYAPLSRRMLPAVAAALEAASLPDAADRLRAGETVTLPLFEHGELIGRLHADHDISAWSLLPEHTRPAIKGEREPSLGIPNANTRIDGPDHQPALVVSTHGDMVLRDAQGIWRCRGPRHEIMSSYIQELASIEQAHPGNCRHLIRSRRDHLKAARTANPSELVVQIDKRLTTDKWESERIEEAAALPGATSDGDIVTIPFSAEHEYALTRLPRTATTWRVLNDARLPPSASRAKQPSLPLPALP